MKKGIFGGAIALSVIGIALVLYMNMQSKPPVIEVGRDFAREIAQYKNGDIFMSPEDLKAQLGSKDLVILDGSNPKTYAREHIPGAISIGFKGLCKPEGKPGDKLWGTILDKDALTKKLESFGIDNNTLVVAYSDTFKGPGAGGRAVWQLRMAGLTNVKLLYGGLGVWKGLGYEVTDEVPVPSPSTGLVLTDYNENHRNTLEGIRDKLDNTVLVDVRSKGEFDGSDTSRGEARGGHIKGALWLEWTDLLKEDGTPKPPETIVAMMAEKGINPQDDFTLY